MKIKKIKLIIVFIFVFLLSPFLTNNILALTISPVRIEIRGNPGEIISGSMELYNERDEIRKYYSSTANFEARGEGGTPSFLSAKDGLALWIQAPESIILNPFERQEIQYTIQIPNNTEYGGYFAAIFWGTSPPAIEEQGQAGEVAIGGKLGKLILLSVGDAEERGGIIEFSAEKGNFFTSLPINFIYRFSNDGNERINPIGDITIKNIFGLTSATINANIVEGNVLPGSIRKFNVFWHTRGQKIGDLTKMEEIDLRAQLTLNEDEKKGFFEIANEQWNNFAFGFYKAELNLVFGNNQKAESLYRFFVIPWQLLSIIFIILIILVFFIAIGIKKYNRWIISKHVSREV